MMLGAGRETKESPIDYQAGMILKKKTGDRVAAGEVIGELFTSQEERLEKAGRHFLESVTIASAMPEKEKLIYARVTEKGIEYL